MNLEEDVNLISASDNQLKQVAELANLQLSLEAEVADLESKLEDKKKEYRRIAEVELPTAMAAAGLEETKLLNGAKVTVKNELTISVPKTKLPWILNWLREQKHDDIIKKDLSVPLGKGFDPKVQAKIEAGLKKLNLVYVVEENVNSTTLKALLREQLEDGKDITLEDFGAFQVRKASIKLPKS